MTASSMVRVLLALCVLLGCDSDPAMGSDAAVTPGVDAGAPETDAATALDAGGPDLDAGPDVDAGPGSDAGALDAGGPDAGTRGSCDGDVGARDQTLSVRHGGLTRTFVVHLPPAYDARAPMPVVLDFHGRNSTSMQQNFVAGMDAYADDVGFISVHPNGVGMTWNGGFCCGEAMTLDVDDVGFTAAMLDALEAELCVDPRRVYATGLSNGGIMAHRLACDLADRITAIAAVAGTNYTMSCAPSRAVPVFHFHGDADTVVPYAGFGGVGSVPSTMSGWASRNGCGATSSTYLTRGDVTCEEWTGCREGATVRLCTIAGGGHQWPGGFTIPGLGYNTSDIVATEAMWAFFQTHALP